MPRTLASVDLQLLRDYDVAATPLHDCECAMLRSQLAALPSLQDISIVGLGAAACLSPGLDLAATFSQLTSIYLGSITSHAGVEKLLPALPASLVQLGLAVDTPDRLTPGAVISDSDRQWLVQLQRGVQMAHLTALTALDVAGTRFVIGEDSQLPPNLVSLKVPMVMHERPLLQLTRLQHLDVHNLDMLGAGGLAGIARCLTQLTSLKAVWMRLEDADAPAIIPALAALPLKSLNVMSYGPPQPAAADDINFPAALGALLGQLTGLASLELATGSYRVADVAASLAHLTGLKVLALSTAADQGGRSGLWGSVASYEALADAIVASKQLRVLRAAAYWLGPAAAEAGRPHPIMRLQAATQLSCLDLCDLEDLGPADDAVQQPDWETLLHSLPGVELGEELTLLRACLQP
ncbi:hypothetical protein OEZ85_003418 [Tetradesmus obliquus]|uniref:Uncharacterized protein n=1 Tax=Tetradesmus obliquus TaxID=3088 RepID=A0ABY8UC09_TETOB|nr:hypothetical protein OEZ85_003418 [Tetradesmus obliquus]